MIKLNTKYEHFEKALVLALRYYFGNDLVAGKPPVIMCIGSDGAVGDAFGPLVGTLLKQSDTSTYVYGALHNTITAQNINEFFSFIKLHHPERKVLCIDASVGQAASVGFVVMDNIAVFPGAAARQKPLGAYGDFSILGITDQKNALTPLNLFKTRLSLVYSMAHITANAIAAAFKQ